MCMTESEAIEELRGLLDVPCEMLVKYASVTTEEQKKALVRIRCAEEMAIYALSEIQQYRAIGTVSEFRELKEKATAKSVNQERGFDKCPKCGEVLNNDCGEQYKFCPDCGQKLLWT